MADWLDSDSAAYDDLTIGDMKRMRRLLKGDITLSRDELNMLKEQLSPRLRRSLALVLVQQGLRARRQSAPKFQKVRLR
jgi:hypothetical protein